MPTLYGLPHCGTCKKAVAWLTEHGVAHTFIDYRAQPLTAEQLDAAAAVLGWEKLVNRASTTWRQLPESAKSPANASEWRALALAHPTLLRRPLLSDRDDWQAGFTPAAYTQRFASGATS
jgi:Spx/MgsR family transcriptional regulator